MTSKLSVIGLALTATIALASTEARAAGCATFSFSPAGPAIPTWNPLTPVMQEATFTMSITEAYASTKRVKLIFTDANSNASPTRVGNNTGPRYEIYSTDAGAVVSYPAGTQVAATNAPLIKVSGNPHSSTTANFRVRILANTSPVEDYTGGNTFSETLGLALQCFTANGSENGTDVYSVAAPTIGVTIPKVLSIVTASPVTINFGNFTTTQQQAVVSVKSTSTLNVAVSTTNGSQLVRAGAAAPYPVNSVIPYAMSFNGVPIAPGSSLVNQTRAGVGGSIYPLQLRLTGGIPSGKLAGTYSDTITLTITPGN